MRAFIFFKQSSGEIKGMIIPRDAELANREQYEILWEKNISHQASRTEVEIIMNEALNLGIRLGREGQV